VAVPALAYVPLSGDVPAALSRVPAGRGVGQILGPQGRSLVVGMAANLRRWAGSHLGLAPRAARTGRPRTNLAEIATAVGWAPAEGAFRQRLVFERLMARLVPLSSRRDLKVPVFLHLDPTERFPRVCVRGGDENLFGPFRDRRAAEKARDAVQRRFSLRPCDYTFEPAPDLPLGTGCVYAQVRSCAAPCLGRVGEREYREQAAAAAAWLADPAARKGEEEASVPAGTGSRRQCAVVVDPSGREASLFPVRGGQVLESAAVVATPDELESAIAGLSWPEGEGPDDWPWLATWMRAPRNRAAYVPFRGDRGALARAVRAALPARFGGNVGASQGQG
jgi:hypothetical protein